MTGVKQLVQNTTVVVSVSQQHLIHTLLHAQQQKFPTHLIRSENSTYALYQPLHGNTRQGRPRTSYIDYIHKLTGRDKDELFGVGSEQGCLVGTCGRVV